MLCFSCFARCHSVLFVVVCSVGSILRVCQVFLWCYFLCSFIVLFFPWCFLVFCCAPSHIQDKQPCYFAFWSLRVSSEVRIYTTDQTKHPGVWSLSRWKQKGIKRYDKHHHKDTLHWPISIITIYIYIISTGALTLMISCCSVKCSCSCWTVVVVIVILHAEAEGWKVRYQH